MINHIPTADEFKTLLENINAVVTGKIFVYKSGLIGNAYINKEELSLQGGSVLENCLRGMVLNAYSNDLKFDNSVKTVAVIGPAYGAINYAPTVASTLEFQYPGIKFIPTRTELDKKKKHFIPEKLFPVFEAADIYIVVEDIVNQGSTIKEISLLTKNLFNKPVYLTLSLCDRGNNTSDSLGIEYFFPFLSVDMLQVHPTETKGLELLNSGFKISINLGKGAGWVKHYGQPPYDELFDPSEYLLELSGK